MSGSVVAFNAVYYVMSVSGDPVDVGMVDFRVVGTRVSNGNGVKMCIQSQLFNESTRSYETVLMVCEDGSYWSSATWDLAVIVRWTLKYLQYSLLLDVNSVYAGYVGRFIDVLLDLHRQLSS